MSGIGESDTTTVEHAAGVFADILKQESEAANAPAPEPTEPEEPPSRFALPGKPDVEVEENAQELPEGNAGLEGEELSTPKPVTPTPSPAAPDARAQAEAAAQQAQAQAVRNQQINQLFAQVASIKGVFQAEFADIKTIDDLEKLAQTDPDRFNRYVIQERRVTQAVNAERQAQSFLQQEQQQAFQRWQAQEQERLPELIPDLKDPEKAPIVASKILDYAKSKGYSPEQLARASASDLAVLHDAMELAEFKADKVKNDAAQAKALAAAKAKAAVAPPVQKPGAQRTTSKDDEVLTDFKRLRKDGSVEAAARLFKTMGI